ncbi:Bug family tripartite tricarboxylate transporter substrate binding protein [Ideonella livida]|uniref:Tripartite tricarboxylate transporter substrate binding protein n=1 Tax=Ideonella livida TaxID=2707176 RepID=A0A7C9TGV6_9BURK|nr:tripartite tricarboxylate transporter substrate binding protein [Ideonella livida]NDY89918.1 tripartite tricarboxylate transporter substrate binding protein [Ideonella livida]
MQRRHLLQAAALGALAPRLGLAQETYPSKVITWICPYGAGGGADIRSRQMAKLIGSQLGQTIIVENRAGGGGNVGTDAIAKAKPDGYTIGMGNFAPLAVNHALFKKLSYDPFNDLIPVMLIERGPLILTVRPDSPFKTVKDIVTAAKTKNAKLSYASGGIGGSHHLSGALFEHSAGIDMTHVPYRSGGAATTDLMGGQVDMMFEQMYAAMPSLKAGKLRGLAITSKERSPLMPDIPTMAEMGYPEVESMNWQGLVVPKGTPAAIVALLNKAANTALKDPVQRELMLAQGNEIGGGTPEAFAAFIKSEAAKWGKVVKAARIEPE